MKLLKYCGKAIFIILLLISFFVVWFWASPKTGNCEDVHELTYKQIIKDASCTESGQMNIICDICGTIVSTKNLEPLGHSFGEYTLLKEPSANQNGIEVRSCIRCLEQEKREIVCQHKEITEIIIKSPTCNENGIKAISCRICDTVLEEKRFEKSAHSYGTWNYSQYATPFDKGTRYKQCSYCEHIVSEDYEFLAPGEKFIYIPGTGINDCVMIGSLTQSVVNSYNIVYAEDYGKNNPYVLGHSNRSLGNLYKTKVGDCIYLCIDGEVRVYKVVVSEFGILNDKKNDIIGQETGRNLLHNFGCETLHMYTCYGPIVNHRWLVLAIKCE